MKAWIRKQIFRYQKRRRQRWDQYLRRWDRRLGLKEPNRDVLGRFISATDYKNRNDYQDIEIAALKQAVSMLMNRSNKCTCKHSQDYD